MIWRAPLQTSNLQHAGYTLLRKLCWSNMRWATHPRGKRVSLLWGQQAGLDPLCDCTGITRVPIAEKLMPHLV